MTPERKAAERIFEFGTLIDAPGEGSVDDIAAIIAEEHAPMRALMERMAPYVLRRVGKTCTCDDCEQGRAVLRDYAEMKKGWEKREAPDDPD